MENELRTQLQEDVVDNGRRKHTRSAQHAADARQLDDADCQRDAKVSGSANACGKIYELGWLTFSLYSKSMSRIEKTIEPMAKHVEGIHHALIGDIDVKVAEMHHLMLTLVTPGDSPILNPRKTDMTISRAETLVADPSDTIKEAIPRPLNTRRKESKVSGNTDDSPLLLSDRPVSRLSSWSSSSRPVGLNEAFGDQVLEDGDLTNLQDPPVRAFRPLSLHSDGLRTSAIVDGEKYMNAHHWHSSSSDSSNLGQLSLPPPTLKSENYPRSEASVVGSSASIHSRSARHDEQSMPLSENKRLAQTLDHSAGIDSSLRKPVTPSQDEAFRSSIFSNSSTLYEG